jgi:hypothetical protein
MLQITLVTGETVNLEPDTVDAVFQKKGDIAACTIQIGTVFIAVAESSKALAKRVGVASGRKIAVVEMGDVMEDLGLLGGENAPAPEDPLDFGPEKV